MFCHTNLGSEASLGVVDGLEELGLRGVVAFGPEDMAEPDRHPVAGFMAEHEALAERCASELVGFRLGVGTVLGQTDELLAASARAAREHGWAVHTHLAEVREEVVGARLRWGHQRGAGRRRRPAGRAGGGRARHLGRRAGDRPAGRGRGRRGPQSGGQHDPRVGGARWPPCAGPASRSGSAPTGPPPTTARTCWRRSRRPPCSRRWPGSTRGPSPPATSWPWPPWRGRGRSALTA